VLHTDDRFVQTVSDAVAEIELTTDAEIVVVAAGRSEPYRDVAVLAGAVGAWLLLLFLLFSPFSFSGSWMPVELPLAGIFVGWVVHRSPRLLRLLVPRGRRVAAVERAAAACFQEEAVHGTRGRTGVLVYVSALEDHVMLLADGGIDAVVPQGEWNALRWGERADPRAPGDLDHFITGLRAAGEILARHVPPTGDNPNEISDAPRIRP
jgi:putative membrane protein